MANAKAALESGAEIKTSVEELYAMHRRDSLGDEQVVFDLPGNHHGVDVYVFEGPTMMEVVRRYNLFSGGGAMPPMWGLGLKYRSYAGAHAKGVMRLMKSIRDFEIPCDVIGLEPGWHSYAYPCSFVWSENRFPNHESFIRTASDMKFNLNLWEHAYVHPASPLHEQFLNKSGDFCAFRGLVVDFATPETSDIYSDYHENYLVKKGITGFKMDECDRAPIGDYNPFNYPLASVFPSGISGEVMTQLYGLFQQNALTSVFRRNNIRTWGDVRATAGLSSSLPFNIYSDTYGFKGYLLQLLNASFSGLLWSPEVRESKSLDELLNRIAMASYAPQMCLNVWAQPHALWLQYDIKKNKAGDLLPENEQVEIAGKIRRLVEKRYALIPYLYASFHRYNTEGIPPVRSLLLDFPDDINLRTVTDQFMFGEALMVAPFMDNATLREVYFPAGDSWIHVVTGEKFEGGTKKNFSGKAGDFPIFIRNNRLLPLAKPVQYVDRDTVFEIMVKAFGDNPEPLVLFEDDGESYDFETGTFNTVALSWNGAGGHVERKGGFEKERYNVNSWQKVAVHEPVVAEAQSGDPAQAGMKMISAGKSYEISSRFQGAVIVDNGMFLNPSDTSAYSFHTQDEQRPTVTIDLEAVAPVSGMTIQNRQDDRPEIIERAVPLMVEVSRDGNVWDEIWATTEPLTEWSFTLKEPIPARYVRIRKANKGFLHLRRAVIYSTP